MSHIPYYNSTGQPPATPNRPVPETITPSGRLVYSTGDHNIDRSLRKPYTLNDIPRDTWYLIIELKDGSKVTLETLIYGVSLSGWMSGYDMSKWRIEHDSK